MTEREWLTVEEIADMLNVHAESVRRWIRSGDLVAVQLGDKAGYRIGRDDLQAFMDARKTSRPGWANKKRRRPEG